MSAADVGSTSFASLVSPAMQISLRWSANALSAGSLPPPHPASTRIASPAATHALMCTDPTGVWYNSLDDRSPPHPLPRRSLVLLRLAIYLGARPTLPAVRG